MPSASCLLAGQGRDTTHIPRQAAVAGWQKTSRDTVSQASMGSKGAPSSSVPAGGTADTRGCTDIAPTATRTLPVPWPAGSTRCLRPGGALGTVTKGTGALSHAAAPQGKSAASLISSVQKSTLQTHGEKECALRG